MIKKRNSAWIIKAKRMKAHSRDGAVLKSASEGRFVVDLLKKTLATAEVLDNISTMSEISVRAKNAAFLDKYRTKQNTKAA